VQEEITSHWQHQRPSTKLVVVVLGNVDICNSIDISWQHDDYGVGYEDKGYSNIIIS
jgi:hypothetical protein